jgi:hypothetical protein
MYEGFITTSREFDPNKFDWGMNFGAGFKTDGGISLGVRYHLCLGNLYDTMIKVTEFTIFLRYRFVNRKIIF